MDGQAWTKTNEGLSLVSYQDTLGFYTIGYGHKLGNDSSLAGTSWTQEQADEAFQEDYTAAIDEALADVGGVCWAKLNAVRQCVITDMAFQLGEAGLNGFHHMIAALLVTDWQTASSPS